MEKQKTVVFCTPTITRPFPQYLEALEESVPVIQAAGWRDLSVFEVGCPYISHARARMLRKALDAGADTIIFIDHDLSWDPQDLLKLIETEGDFVAGTYRFKRDDEERYMGTLFTHEDGRPIVRADGCIKAEWVPAGFLKITRAGVRRFMRAYPELLFGPPENPSVDLFNFGAHKGVLYGEDYAASRNWNDLGGEIWIIPDLNLTHWAAETRTMVPGSDPPHWRFHKEKPYKGNFHRYLLAQAGGRVPSEDAASWIRQVEERTGVAG